MDADAWDRKYAAADLLWSAGPNRFVAEQCEALGPGRAVDLAAGEGRHAIWLAARGWQATAVDFSPVAIERGSGLPGGDLVSWVLADATTWEPPEPVDLVVVAYLQLPREEQRRAVAGAVAALAPGGTLVWVAHDRSNLTEGTGGPQDPAVLPTTEDLLADLGAIGTGLHVSHAGRVARTVGEHDHGGSTGTTAYDCLIVARRRVARPDQRSADSGPTDVNGSSP